MSILNPSRPIINIDYFWRYKVLPRFGMLGMFNKRLLPFLVKEPKWNIVETVSQNLKTPNMIVQHSLRYILSGYLPNSSVAMDVLNFLLKHPAILPVIPLEDFCISWMPMKYLQSICEHEQIRLNDLTKDLLFLKINHRFYYVTKLPPDLFTVSETEQLNHLKKNRVCTIPLPQVQDSHMILAYKNVYCINVRYILKLLNIII